MDRERLAGLLRAEEERFVEQHPRSRELFEQGKRSLLAGVPMPWMTEWAGAYPVFAAKASRPPTSPTWTATATWTSAWATPVR